jgi:hypothetical protein
LKGSIVRARGNPEAGIFTDEAAARNATWQPLRTGTR